MAPAFPIEALSAAISGQLPDDPDWEALIAAANRTLTTGSLAGSVLANADRLPDDVRQFLAVIYERTLTRNDQMRAQLVEAVEALSDAGVEPVLFKGSVLLLSAEESGMQGRLLTDLDLMVAEDDLKAAVGALEALDYKAEQATAWSKMVPVVLSRETDAGTIDLHHNVYGNFPALGHGDLLAGATPVDLGRGRAWVPTMANQIAVLVIHDQLRDRDYWRGSIDLRHLLDSAAIARAEGGVDWQALNAVFPSGYPNRALRTHLLTLHVLLGTDVPTERMTGVRPRMQFRRRMAQIKWPGIQLPATIISLISDPPWRAVFRIVRTLRKNAGKRSTQSSLLRSTRSASRIIKGFILPNDLGKS